MKLYKDLLLMSAFVIIGAVTIMEIRDTHAATSCPDDQYWLQRIDEYEQIKDQNYDRSWAAAEKLIDDLKTDLEKKK